MGEASGFQTPSRTGLEREAERRADREYEQREYNKLLAFKAEEKAKKEQADKEEADHRATMRRIADSLDAIAALLARQK